MSDVPGKADPHSVKEQKNCLKRDEADSGSANSTKSMEYEVKIDK
jgi:hypothetical protein